MSEQNLPQIHTDRNKQRIKKNLVVTIIGECGVGKSSLALRFAKGEFHNQTQSTVGAAFLTGTVSFDQYETRLEIWDTAGQERYHCLAPLYYRCSKASIIVYDVTKKESFQKVKQWAKELQEHGSSDMTIALAGNKVDLENEREVTSKEAKAYAESQGFIFRETSAKTCACVKDMFVELARKAMILEESERPTEKHSVSQYLVDMKGNTGHANCICN